MVRLKSNFQRGSLDSTLSSTATELTDDQFTTLPEVTGGDILVLVLDPAGVNGDPEIVYVTSHAGGATPGVYVSRGQENTSAREHPSGTRWIHTVTAEDYRVRSVVTVTTSTYAVVDDDYLILCDASSNAITVALPSASSKEGRELTIKKVDATGNAVTIDGDASENIDGSSSASISSQYESVTLISNGSDWYII